MIDIEAKVFNTVYTAVSSVYTDIDMSSMPIENPAELPHVSLFEAGNRNYDPGDTIDRGIENYVRVVYQADVFSNKKDTAKSEARAIAALIDNSMKAMGFRRSLSSQIPNVDRSIYRYTLRYEGVVSKGVAVGQNTVHTIFTP